MAQAVTRRGLAQPGVANGGSEGSLEHGFMKMMTTAVAGRRVPIESRRGEDPLPCPLLRGAWILHGESAREFDIPGPESKVLFVLAPNGMKVIRKDLPQRAREQSHPVFLAFAIAYDELVTREVDVLRSQACALEEPQARSVKERRHELWNSSHPIKDGSHFGPGQDHWQVPRASRPNEVLDPWRWHLQNLCEEKHECAEGLLVCRSAGAAIVREVVQKALDLQGAEFAWVAALMETNESLHPCDVGSFGSAAVMAAAELNPCALEQPMTFHRAG
jgi:hypothetical protein